MNTRLFAQALGRRGGLARAKRLSAEERRKIASLGGRTKDLSAKAGRRIETNFQYLKVVKELRKTPKPKSSSRIDHPLPRIHANAK